MMRPMTPVHRTRIIHTTGASMVRFLASFATHTSRAICRAMIAMMMKPKKPMHPMQARPPAASSLLKNAKAEGTETAKALVTSATSEEFIGVTQDVRRTIPKNPHRGKDVASFYRPPKKIRPMSIDEFHYSEYRLGSIYGWSADREDELCFA